MQIDIGWKDDASYNVKMNEEMSVSHHEKQRKAMPSNTTYYNKVKSVSGKQPSFYDDKWKCSKWTYAMWKWNMKCITKALQQNVMQCILMQSKDSVRRGAQRSYDDEKRPVGFVYSLQWPLNEGGVEHKY